MIKIVGLFLLIVFLLFVIWVILRMSAEVNYIEKKERRARKKKKTTNARQKRGRSLDEK